MRLAVLTAAEGAAWEADLVTAWDAGQFGVIVARRCVDVVDLLAVAASGQGGAALISATLRRLDADVVDRLTASGVVPVAVLPADPSAGSTADGDSETRVRALGIEHVVSDDAEPAVVAAVVLEAVRAERSEAQPADPAKRAMFGDPGASLAVPPGGRPAQAPTPPTRRGCVLAVWGPAGAPGRTTVATGLSDAIAQLGLATLLVDADVYGASVGAALGLLDDSPGLAAACRQASSERLEPPSLAALCWQLSPGLRVLTGLPVAARWPELRPPAVSAVLDTARALADFVVVDCGFCLETDEELSFDTLAPRRNAATLSVLAAADVVVAVGAADPIGMQRLVRGLADLRDLDLPTEPWVVLNKVRRGVVPGDPVAELTGALERFAGCRPAALLPADQAGVDSALAQGRFLSEAGRHGALRDALGELAAQLTGAPASGRRRRRATRRRELV